MDNTDYFVLMRGGNAYNGIAPRGSPWLLKLEPQDKATCARAISWQRQGGNSEYMAIATRVGPATFRTKDSETLNVIQGFYTDAAWAHFLATWEA